jgi:dihydrofolate reductase
MKLRLTAVVAMTPDRIIGRDGKLPWHLPEDLAFFKRTTLGHPVVMGRKTFESIGRPLPKRRNIVLTRDPGWSAPGVEIIYQPEELLKMADLCGQAFVIGGAEIYAAFSSLLDDWLVTHVTECHPGDTRLADFEADFPAREHLETHAGFQIWRHFRVS